MVKSKGFIWVRGETSSEVMHSQDRTMPYFEKLIMNNRTEIVHQPCRTRSTRPFVSLDKGSRFVARVPLQPFEMTKFQSFLGLTEYCSFSCVLGLRLLRERTRVVARTKIKARPIFVLHEMRLNANLTSTTCTQADQAKDPLSTFC